MAMDRLQFDCEVKLAGDDAAVGTVEGYASVFNIIDRGGDVVLPGAFKASLAALKKSKGAVPILWMHDSWNPIGIWSELEEDSRGLKVKGDLILDVPQAAAARALVRGGAVKGLSIGYRTVDHEIDRVTGVRRLKKVELIEISLVTFPMLPEAQITGVKGELDPRALELELKEALNLSSAAAVRAVAICKKHLRDGGGQTQHDPRDGAKDMLMSLRRTAALLGD
jgi:HK97 family phage prohead protease